MAMKSIAMVALCALTLPAAAQVYKCPDASGRTVIQQTPCAGGQQMTVRPASGHAEQAKTQTAQERLQKLKDDNEMAAASPARPTA